MNGLKKMMKRINGMSRPAYLAIKVCLMISNLYLVGALMILVYAGSYSGDTYELHLLAKELFNIPQAILIIAGIGSLLLEDAAKKLE